MRNINTTHGTTSAGTKHLDTCSNFSLKERVKCQLFFEKRFSARNDVFVVHAEEGTS